jgi:transcriptional regulator with XRE-family HTH domain
MITDAEIGARVLARREQAGIGQNELARRLGRPFHQQTIARLERGERKIGVGEALLIAHALDCSLDELLHDQEVRPLTAREITERIADLSKLLLEVV